MSIFKGVSKKDIQRKADTLSVGSGGFLKETGVYDLDIETLHLEEEEGRPTYLCLTGKIGETIYRERFMILNKEGKTYSEFGGKKRTYAGFLMADSIVRVLTEGECELIDVGDWFEKKVVKVYDFDQKAEVNKELPVLCDDNGPLGGLVKAAIYKRIENKRALVDEEWIDTNEKRESNTISVVADIETKQTANELLDDADAEFLDAWAEKNEGKDLNFFKEVKESGGARRGGRVAGSSRNFGGNSGEASEDAPARRTRRSRG